MLLIHPIHLQRYHEQFTEAYSQQGSLSMLLVFPTILSRFELQLARFIGLLCHFF